MGSPPVPLFNVLLSFITILTTILVAMCTLLIAQTARRFERQQRRVNTVDLLGKFYRDMMLPLEAIENLPADEFVLGIRNQRPEKMESFITIMKYLNEMEMVAILINSGTVDEGLAKRLMRTSLVNAFHSMIEYIMKVRAKTDNSALYNELETLAHRWGDSRDL